jgi:hypothetical protein
MRVTTCVCTIALLMMTCNAMGLRGKHKPPSPLPHHKPPSPHPPSLPPRPTDEMFKRRLENFLQKFELFKDMTCAGVSISYKTTQAAPGKRSRPYYRATCFFPVIQFTAPTDMPDMYPKYTPYRLDTAMFYNRDGDVVETAFIAMYSY